MYNDDCSEIYILIYDCEIIESNVPFLTFHLVILKNVSKNVSKKKNDIFPFPTKMSTSSNQNVYLGKQNYQPFFCSREKPWA